MNAFSADSPDPDSNPSKDDLSSPARSLDTSNWFPRASLTELAATIVLCMVFLLTGLNRLQPASIWGHLCFGRWMSQTGDLPKSDPFAAETTGLVEKFANVPWLPQRIGFWFYQTIGMESLIVAHSMLAVIACGVMMATIVLRGVPAWEGVAGGLIMYLISFPAIGILRPQLLGLVGLSLVLLASGQILRRLHPLCWLPVVMGLWANCHASCILGLGVLALGVVSDAIDCWWNTGRAAKRCSDKVVRRRLWLFLLCTLAACLNPLGTNLLLRAVPLWIGPALVDIPARRPLDLVSLSGILFFTSLLITAFVIRHSRRRFRPVDVLLLTVFGVLALTSPRMLGWWGIVWPWMLLPHACSIWWPSGNAEDDSVEDDSADGQLGRSAVRTLFAMACVFATLRWAPASQPSLNFERPSWFGQDNGIRYAFVCRSRNPAPRVGGHILLPA